MFFTMVLNLKKTVNNNKRNFLYQFSVLLLYLITTQFKQHSCIISQLYKLEIGWAGLSSLLKVSLGQNQDVQRSIFFSECFQNEPAFKFIQFFGRIQLLVIVRLRFLAKVSRNSLHSLVHDCLVFSTSNSESTFHASDFSNFSASSSLCFQQENYSLSRKVYVTRLDHYSAFTVYFKFLWSVVVVLQFEIEILIFNFPGFLC